ncbi:uncharacterized protein LOC120091709 [Benincasa hispida]|uniref:uncharacterized protein LOC120091709 n=1 Tax=Benincasa hispida TaxID=102211 RepID=UPI00190107EF|nr:uncharacterized protein LOC120091709 [Benincasa hispida]
MKRQNSFLSSSSQVEISSDNFLRRSHRHHGSRSFGCVSSLLHFLSNNNHSRRNKSITFVHNSIHELDNAISKSNISQSPKHESAANLLISSSDSPQIAERSESTMSTTTVERFRGARGPIVRLMGLESSTAEEGVPAAVEKQRQIMEALEKCEQDLKVLKEFIEAFESTESFRSSSPAGEGKRIELMVLKQKEEASPVALSVVEELSRRRHFVNTMFFHRPSANSGRMELQQIQQMQRKKPEGDMMMFNNLSKFDSTKTKIHEIVIGNWKSEKAAEQSPLCRSKVAMRDSVEQVFKEISWGQNKEMGRIGLALQNQICGDLIEELVKDLNYNYTCGYYSSLPFEACKRRLCF